MISTFHQTNRQSARLLARAQAKSGLQGAIPLFLSVLTIAISGCDQPAPAKVAKTPKVIVTTPVVDTVIDFQDFTGRLDAVKMVEIRARVSGYVTEIPFKEGDFVKEGNLLFQIDVRPYEADLNQAEANLKLAIADRNLQEKNAERSKRLISAAAIAREEYETTLAALDRSKASVGSMEAARDRAKLYLDYTRVLAPISGRISRRFVDPFNLINADNTVLTTMVTEDPVYAYFDVDERSFIADILPAIAPGKRSWTEGLKFPVMMRLANEKEFERIGYVDFVDNRVVSTTGTVRMRGVFQNPDGLLMAGLFVRIRLPIGTAYKAIVIPDEAIQSDQERKYVYVLNSKNEVEYRSVKLGQSLRDLRVIRPPDKGKEGQEGIVEGERVIVAGMQRVRKGIEVEPEMQNPPAAPDMPLVKLLSSWRLSSVR